MRSVVTLPNLIIYVNARLSLHFRRESCGNPLVSRWLLRLLVTQLLITRSTAEDETNGVGFINNRHCGIFPQEKYPQSSFYGTALSIVSPLLCVLSP